MSKPLATWFSPSLGVKQRSKGASAIAASAYRACIKLTDERTGITHDYTKKSGHVKTFTIGPFDDINELWQAAEKSETRKNSVVARELITPLPSDWNDSQRETFSRELAESLRSTYGVAVQVSLHRQNNNNKNEHAHIMFTTRVVNDNKEFLDKTRSLDLGRDAKDKEGNIIKGELSKLRESTCALMNRHAEKNNSNWYVHAGKFNEIKGMEDHVSLKHIPIVSKDKLTESSNYDVVTKAQEHNARVIEYRKHKSDSKESTQEQEYLQRLIAEDEAKKIPTFDTPTKPIIVKKAEEPEYKLIYIQEDWIKAHKRLETLTFAKLDAERDFLEFKKHGREHINNEPKVQKNIFGFETKQSKLARDQWSTTMQSLENEYRERKAKINSYSTSLENETLQANAQSYLRAIEHNRLVEAEREARIKREKELREQQERSFDYDSSDSIEARMNEFNQRERRQTQQHYTTPGMGF